MPRHLERRNLVMCSGICGFRRVVHPLSVQSFGHLLLNSQQSVTAQRLMDPHMEGVEPSSMCFFWGGAAWWRRSAGALQIVRELTPVATPPRPVLGDATHRDERK